MIQATMGSMPPSPSGIARQRLMATAAGLGVAALAAAAFALSYEDLRVLALVGGAATRYAPVYPIMIDTLVVVTILSLVVARRTPWWTRGVRWLLLLVLLAGAAAASAQRAVKGYDPLPDKWLSAGVAIAPWVLLLLAAWLWLSMFRQARLLFGRPGAGTPRDARGAVPPSGTVRVVAPRLDSAPQDETDQLVPGLAAPPGDTERPDRPVAPSTLPTDIKLVTHRATATETTQPDLVMPRRAGAEPAPDGPADTVESTENTEKHNDAENNDNDAGTAENTEDDDVERWSALAAEDAERWAEEAADHFGGAPEPNPAPTLEWIPPGSKFRSSPTPPRD
jgi:hypothetical protein